MKQSNKKSFRKNQTYKSILRFLSLSILLQVTVGTTYGADQAVKDANGSIFMEEVSTPSSAQKENKGGTSKQTINTESGSVFMEEVPQTKKSAAPKRVPIDLSGLGIPVDPKGRIIPLISPESGPVMRNFSKLELEYTPPAVYVPMYSPNLVPFAYGNQRTPWGSYPSTIYGNPLYGYFPVPLGIPQYFSSSSDAPPGSQLDYGNSGSYFNYPGFTPPSPPGGSIWNPNWRTPWRPGLYVPKITQFENRGSIRPIFPQNLDD